ncbi:MAG: hypothetical protein AABX71_03530 [Nanoarchaeota archaeon]
MGNAQVKLMQKFILLSVKKEMVGAIFAESIIIKNKNGLAGNCPPV